MVDLRCEWKTSQPLETLPPTLASRSARQGGTITRQGRLVALRLQSGMGADSDGSSRHELIALAPALHATDRGLREVRHAHQR